MTHIETSRVNEMLGLQIGAIREAAGRLQGDDLEHLETILDELEKAIKPSGTCWPACRIMPERDSDPSAPLPDFPGGFHIACVPGAGSLVRRPPMRLDASLLPITDAPIFFQSLR